MTAVERLGQALRDAQEDRDLPDYLAHQVLYIIEHPEEFAGREPELAALAEQIDLYDTYGQTGYLGMGVNHVILEKALKTVLR